MKKILINIFSILLVLAIFYFLGKEFVRNWDHIKNFSFTFNISLVLLASGLYAVHFALFAIGWQLILRFLHHPISLLDALTYFCMCQPARYIPGKIWMPVARMKICKPHNVPPSITLLSAGVEAVFEIIAGMYVSIFAILQTNILGKFSIAGIVIATFVGLLLLYPPIFYSLINIYLKIVKQPSIQKDQRAPFSMLLLIQIIYLIALATLGISQLIFLQSFAPVGSEHFALLVSVGAFSYVASIVVLPAPGGLGVREGIWYFALKPITEGSVALIYAFVSRLWTIVIEAVLLFISLLLFFLRNSLRARQTNVLRRPE